MIDTLFGLIPSGSSLRQWVARELQVVNWGVFDGAHRVLLGPDATLLAGASGSGKSTLMDAYIALLMPHTTPFNGASNGSVVGRPRGKDQRNIISYARGKLDETRTASGVTSKVLRGAKSDTWSAVALTWVDQAGAEFTGLRAWYVPTAATSMEGVVTLRATFDRAFDLATLESAVASKFAKAKVAALGLTTYDTDKEFTAKLYQTLGIGAAGGGEKAAGLLARIQAGQQITTVDSLYKSMVLEVPSTYSKADAVVLHFDELSATRELMLTAAAQLETLSPMRKQRALLDDARARLSVLDHVAKPIQGASAFLAGGGSVNPTGAGGRGAMPTVFDVWRAQRRIELLRGVEGEVRDSSWEADRTARELDAQIQGKRQELSALRQQQWVTGGDAVHNAERELAAAQRHLEEVRRNRAQIEDAARLFDVRVSNAGDFAHLAAEAQAALNDDGVAAGSARDAALLAEKAAEARLRALNDELASMRKRRGNVPDHLHRARMVLAEAAGLTEEQLPFVAELIEVQVAHENWRDAFNLALGGFATTLLVDEATLPAFRSAIDPVPTSARLRFEGIKVGQTAREHLDPATLPGRLEFARSGFSGTLQDILAQRFSFVCVSDASHLRQHHKALTRAGQTSEGRRGAHGGGGKANVLGFTNARGIFGLEERIADCRRELELAAAAFRGADLRVKAFAQQRAAAALISNTTWEAVDSFGAAAAVARWQEVIETAQSDNPQAAELSGQAAALDAEIQALTERLGSLKAKAGRLAEKWEGYSEQVDAAQVVIDLAADAGLTVSEPAREYLNAAWSTGPAPEGSSIGPAAGDGHDRPGPVAALNAFDAQMARASQRLAQDRELAQTALDAAAQSLHTIFKHYLARWPNPNLGTDPDHSYRDFEHILNSLETEGLHVLEEAWSRSLAQLTGADLADLDRTIQRAMTEITERIKPVNAILGELPFADGDHRLQITWFPLDSHLVAKFRKQLRELAGSAPTADNSQRQVWYHKMSKLIDRIRPGSPERNELIDVRRHIRFSAEKVDLAGNHVALYDHIGEKSGGESQELVAFIVGAALRYQLGDAAAQRPRYAPVFLDEALIKADAKFTGRALGAWRGLGFQLIVGAPNDKVSALEPHVSASYVVVKSPSGKSHARPIVSLAA